MFTQDRADAFAGMSVNSASKRQWWPLDWAARPSQAVPHGMAGPDWHLRCSCAPLEGRRPGCRYLLRQAQTVAKEMECATTCTLRSGTAHSSSSDDHRDRGYACAQKLQLQALLMNTCFGSQRFLQQGFRRSEDPGPCASNLHSWCALNVTRL